MKTRTRKCGIFAALAAVLLIMAALIVSCVDPINSDSLVVKETEEPISFVPPPGMAYIRLNVGVESFSDGARTTMPTTTAYTVVTDFSKREVYVSGGDGGSYGNLAWDGTSDILVNADATAYTVTVVGYNSSNVAVAAGSGNVTIATPGSGTVTISMKEITSTGAISGAGTATGGNGTFALNLTNTGNVDTALVTVTGLSAGTGNVSSTDALTTTSFSLAPGYYRMELELEKTGFASVTIRDVIVIWSGLTSTYTRALSLKANVHTVTYTFNDARDPAIAPNPSLTTTKDFDHGDNFTHPGAGTAPDYLDGTNAVVSTNVFGGWWTGTGSPNWGTEWVTAGTPTKVIKPETLYARWATPDSTVAFTVTVSFSSHPTITFDDGAGGTIAANVSQTASTPVVFRVAPAFTGTLTTPTYEWLYEGSGTSLSTTDTLSVDFSSDLKYQLPGPHEFYLEIKDNNGTVPIYSGTITITVQ